MRLVVAVDQKGNGQQNVTIASSTLARQVAVDSSVDGWVDRRQSYAVGFIQ